MALASTAVLLVLVVVLAAWARRVASRPRDRPACCAICRGRVDRDRLRCLKCGVDVREGGLVAPDAGAAPNWLIVALVWTIAAPFALTVIAGYVEIELRSPASSGAELAPPVIVRAEGPASGAYDAVTVSFRTAQRDWPGMRTPRRPAFLLATLEDASGDIMATLAALRDDDTQPLRLDATEGRALTTQSIADWLADAVPSLSPHDAALEAYDIFRLQTSAGWTAAERMSRLGALEPIVERYRDEEVNRVLALSQSPGGPDLSASIAPTSGKYRRILDSGVWLDRFERWDRHELIGGWGRDASPPETKVRHAVRFGLWGWLLGAFLIVGRAARVQDSPS